MTDQIQTADPGYAQAGTSSTNGSIGRNAWNLFQLLICFVLAMLFAIADVVGGRPA